MTEQPETILSVERVSVHFGGLAAISDMRFAVKRGEIVGLIGPNGAGKTTAFNVITGFLRPTDGDVRYHSQLITGFKPHEISRLGLVRTFQRTSVFWNRSVFDNVLTGLHCSGRSSLADALLQSRREKSSERELRESAWEILRFVDLDQRAEQKAGVLAYGEQRLLGIALALAVKPTMLLLDEPVSGMNQSETARVVELVKKINNSGVTILLVEHDMQMVMKVCGRIVVLNYGRIIAEGSPVDIQSNPEVVRAYLGQGKKRA
ncbi:MAG: ABC transporter ATP-binding protein [Bradyrhizobiaceae bacterium]|nr:ABC transporter ATP-binding protein [Bradyrhizobiaceae bacterium]